MSRTYARYRDSGVEWLGEVPEHWEVCPFQRVLRESLKYGANEAAELDDPGLPRFVRITDIDEVGRLRDETFRSLPLEVAEPYLLASGDLLFARSGSVGRTFLYDESWGSCAYAGYLIRARVNHAHVMPEFISYFSASQSYMHWLRTVAIQATIENVNAERYSRMPIPLPPLDEQRAIAAFLDRETERIDALVERKRRLIERLQEYRTTLITRTVTHGLPPEAARAAGLNPSPPLKPSGVEWLGAVPEHWEVKPLRSLVSFRGGATPNKAREEFWDGDIPWVSPKDMKRASIGDSEDHVTAAAVAASPITMLPLDTVLVVVRGMILAHSFPVAVTAAPVTINQDMKALFSQHPLSHIYLYWYLVGTGPVIVSLCDESAHGTRKLESATLALLPIPVPRPDEQLAIATFLDGEMERIDTLVRRVESNIERLQENRTALITAAVTGKIDVREAAPEPVAASTA